MFKELTLQNIWKSEMPVENGRRFKLKSTLWCWGRQLTSRSSGQVRSGQLLFSNRLVRSGQVRSVGQFLQTFFYKN